MNKFVFGALATAVVGATGFASETEWPELDRELEALSTTIQTQTASPFALSGWIISAWDTSGDIQVADGASGANDLGGFDIRSARMRAEGDIRNYGYRLEFDFGSGNLRNSVGDPDATGEGGSGSAQLLDAYGSVTVAESFKITIGQFRQPFLQSGLIDRNRTLFVDRTELGQVFARRDAGAMLSGKFSQVGWYLAAQNGFDGRGDDYLLTGRVTVDILGEGAGYNSETAYGAAEGTNLFVAAALSDDGSVDKGTRFGGEAYLTSGPFYVSGEIVSNDDDLGDNTPWNLTGAYLIQNAYEIALRWQELDTANDERVYGAGVNWYHDDWNTKWQLQWQRLDSSVDDDDADVITLGFVVSF